MKVPMRLTQRARVMRGLAQRERRRLGLQHVPDPAGHAEGTVFAHTTVTVSEAALGEPPTVIGRVAGALTVR